MEKLRFLNEKQVTSLCHSFGTPAFVYDQATLEHRAGEVLAFPNAFGLTARYAMKASPNAAIIRTFNRMGLHIDASSAYEVERALRAGIPPEHIQLTAQELPGNLMEVVDRGVSFNACSLHQLRIFGRHYPGRDVSVRINPGLGSGHSNRTNVCGPSASFGIWHEHLDHVFSVAGEFGLRVTGMHTHIGSGTDPDVWVRCAQLSLGIAARMPDVARLSLGGGFKAARMHTEISADLQKIGEKIKAEFEAFAQQQGRKLHLEIEPGTYLVANAGALVCRVMDIVDTGENGYTFIKVDSGMTEILRPSLYGAQHPIIIVPQIRERRKSAKYLVVGHCCESGDILTPKPGNPEQLKPRVLKEARIGDALVIEGAGAYCAAMSSKNYNSFPECAEVLLTTAGKMVLIRRKQTLDQVLQNECSEEAVS